MLQFVTVSCLRHYNIVHCSIPVTYYFSDSRARERASGKWTMQCQPFTKSCFGRKSSRSSYGGGGVQLSFIFSNEAYFVNSRMYDWYRGKFYFMTLPPMDLLHSDCTRNHTVLKYMSYRVNFWQKSLVYKEGISRIILWKLLFLANCIVRNQQL